MIIKFPISYVQPEKTIIPEAEALIGAPTLETISIPPCFPFAIENLYFRKDRIKKPQTSLKCIEIKKNMGWCDNPFDLKNYNKLIKLNKKIKYEKLYRKDYKYDLLIPIKYNFLKPVKFKGSCIFIHLTDNYKPTLGCVAMKKKDFLIMLRLINKKTKILIT